MKKSLIALAVAGAMTAPIVAQADATLYGSLRVKVVDVDGSDNTLTMKDNVSRVGIRGKQETQFEGVNAVYRLEWGVKTQNGDEDVFHGRLGYVGITTDYGDFLFGRQWTPHFLMASSMVDILDGESNPTNAYGRASEVVSYTSPLMMGGLRVAVAGAFGTGDVDDDVAGTSKEEIDSTHLGAKYDIAGFSVAGSYVADNVNDDNDVASIAASYTLDALYVAGQYTDYDDAAKKKVGTVAATGAGMYELVASYDIADVKLLAQYVDFDENNDDIDLGSQASIEAWYKLGSKARGFVSYTDFDSDAEDNTGKADTLSVGYRVDF